MTETRTLLIHEIEGHGFSFEVSTSDGQYLGSFERIEAYPFSEWEAAHDAEGNAPDYVAPRTMRAGG